MYIKPRQTFFTLGGRLPWENYLTLWLIGLSLPTPSLKEGDGLVEIVGLRLTLWFVRDKMRGWDGTSYKYNIVLKPDR
jgi:hypothetical protein